MFSTFVAAALLTLLLDWDVPWQRRVGVGSQWAVGSVGFVQCAAVLMTQRPRLPTRGTAA